jgi:hypothetical protein
MSAPIVHFKGDTSPSLADTIKVNGAAFDLTNASSVKFQLRLATGSTKKVDAVATVVSAAAGTVRYDWLAADVDTPGIYVGWWLVNLTNGRPQTSDEFLLEIRDHGPSAGHLSTLAGVRDYLQKRGEDRAQDTTILQLLGAASKAMMRYVEREFAPQTNGATRRFPLDPVDDERVIDLTPYDLRNITSVALSPESTSPKALAIDVDYQPLPIQKFDGVYGALELSRLLPLVSTSALRFGRLYLDVTGDWGFPSVPEDVDQWCKVTVWTWMRRDVQSFSTSFQIDEQRLERPEALPSAVRAGLRDAYLRRR